VRNVARGGKFGWRAGSRIKMQVRSPVAAGNFAPVFAPAGGRLLLTILMRFSPSLSFLLVALVAGLTGPAAFAQTGSIGIGTTTPDPRAALDISAADKGLLIPRLDSAQRAAIPAPPDGLMVFQKDGRRGLWYAFGGTWVFIPDVARTGRATNGLSNPGSGTVGLGGTLTEPVTVVEAGANSLELRSLAPTAAVDQQQSSYASATPLTVPLWQSFTVGRTGLLTGFDVTLTVSTGGTLTATLRQGEGTGGAIVATQTLSVSSSSRLKIPLTLTTPLPVVAGTKYTLQLQQTTAVFRWWYNTGNPYPGGRSNISTTQDFTFSTYMQANAGLAVAAGQVRLTGLSGPALLNVGADGTVGTQSVASVTDNLGNHVATQDIVLGGNQLVGQSGQTGLTMNSNGALALGWRNPSPFGGRLQVHPIDPLEDAVVVDLNGSSAAYSLKINHNGSNFLVRPLSAGSTSTVVENTASGNLLLNPSGGNVGVGSGLVASDIQLQVISSNATENGLYVGLNGNSAAYSLRLNHGTSNLTVRAPSAGSIHTVLENTTSGGALLLNPAGNAVAAGGMLVVDNANANAGTWSSTAPMLRFGSMASGEGILSKRTSGGNRYGLDFYTASQPRLSINAAGQVGVGTTNPTETLEVNGNVKVSGNVQMGFYTVQLDDVISGNTTSERFLTCPSGMRVLGGGGGHRDFNFAASSIDIHYSGPDTTNPQTAWRIIVRNNNSSDRAVRFYCNCARIQ
jgi:hypothetical protein